LYNSNRNAKLSWVGWDEGFYYWGFEILEMLCELSWFGRSEHKVRVIAQKLQVCFGSLACMFTYS